MARRKDLFNLSSLYSLLEEISQFLLSIKPLTSRFKSNWGLTSLLVAAVYDWIRPSKLQLCFPQKKNKVRRGQRHEYPSMIFTLVGGVIVDPKLKSVRFLADDTVSSAVLGSSPYRPRTWSLCSSSVQSPLPAQGLLEATGPNPLPPH